MTLSTDFRALLTIVYNNVWQYIFSIYLVLDVYVVAGHKTQLCLLNGLEKNSGEAEKRCVIFKSLTLNTDQNERDADKS